MSNGRERAAPGVGFKSFVRAQPSDADAHVALRTLRDLLRFAVTRFEAAGLAYGHGTDNARDEAAWLLLWSLHLPPDELDTWLDCRLTGAEIGHLAAIRGAIGESGTGILLVEHHTDFVFRVCDRVTALDRGRPIKHGRPDEVRRDAEVVRVYLGA